MKWRNRRKKTNSIFDFDPVIKEYSLCPHTIVACVIGLKVSYYLMFILTALSSDFSEFCGVHKAWYIFFLCIVGLMCAFIIVEVYKLVEKIDRDNPLRTALFFVFHAVSASIVSAFLDMDGIPALVFFCLVLIMGHILTQEYDGYDIYLPMYSCDECMIVLTSSSCYGFCVCCCIKAISANSIGGIFNGGLPIFAVTFLLSYLLIILRSVS